jgi:hypothetical protein
MNNRLVSLLTLDACRVYHGDVVRQNQLSVTQEGNQILVPEGCQAKYNKVRMGRTFYEG